MMNKKIKAFGLIKLSVALVVVAILTVGAALALNANVTSNKIKLTNYRIAEIYKAMGAYLLLNKRLPCPASINLIKGDANYGLEVTGGVFCGTGAGSSAATGVYAGTSGTGDYLAYGAVPIQALSLPSEMAEDAYGTRFAYIVHRYSTVVCETVPNFSNNNFCTPATGSVTRLITINQNGVALATDAIFAIVSYGPNKSGGFNSSSLASSTTQITRSSDSGETDNDAGAAASFVTTAGANTAAFDNILNNSVVSSSVFDDIVFFKSRDSMVKDFKGLFLIPCAADPSFGGYAWPVARYDEAAISTTNCAVTTNLLHPTRRCGALGTWGAIVTACF